MGNIFMGAVVSMAVSIDNPGKYGLSDMGFIYRITGITHRDDWRNNN